MGSGIVGVFQVFEFKGRVEESGGTCEHGTRAENVLGDPSLTLKTTILRESPSVRLLNTFTDAALTRPNLSLYLNSKSSFSRHAASNRGLNSKLSSSLQSLTSIPLAFIGAPESFLQRAGFSCPGKDLTPGRIAFSQVKSMNSCSEGTGALTLFDETDDGDVRNATTTPENLYLMGMELFEEALRRWEQALNFRSRLADDEGECSSDIFGGEFIRKLESLLQRAYQLQEEFEGVLGFVDPSSHHSEKHAEVSTREDLDNSCWRDTVSIGSNDSFVSAAELSEQKSALALTSLCRSLPFYEEALQMAEDGKISCRVLRTEMLECLGDTDFLAKLHCIRQACQVILQDTSTRKFLADTGKKILSSIIVRARKNPKRFEEVYEEMIIFLEQTDHWENTEVELSARGVKHLNFYDIVLDFILMDSFEDLENPPQSIMNVVNNRWLNNAFKETAVASSCWSVLKQKRQHVKDQDGFIVHFYSVCQHISPELAWGFLGPKSSLHDFCYFFKEQVLLFLKDIFDLEKVRYSSVDTLAEEVQHLLHYRAELIVNYSDSTLQANGCVGATSGLASGTLPETQEQ
ncbi:mitoguardin 1 isoform X1 [Silurus meridionalis]|nr:mitoguardin 1 isoform X1 [Silurus meridionalis]